MPPMSKEENYVAIKNFARERGKDTSTVMMYITRHDELKKACISIDRRNYIDINSDAYKELDAKYPLRDDAFSSSGCPLINSNLLKNIEKMDNLNNQIKELEHSYDELASLNEDYLSYFDECEKIIDKIKLLVRTTGHDEEDLISSIDEILVDYKLRKEELDFKNAEIAFLKAKINLYESRT